MTIDEYLFAQYRGYLTDGNHWYHPQTRARIDLPRTMRLWHLICDTGDVALAVRLTVPRP